MGTVRSEEKGISRELILKNSEGQMKELKFPGDGDGSRVIPPLHSFSAEQFRKVKTYISLLSPPIRTILITSAIPQEGKSTIAMNLALAFAQEKQGKTILINADLRMSNTYHFQSAGLADYLSGQASGEEILLYFAEQNLTLIPAGTPSSMASDLIGSPQMSELLENLRKQEENAYILIDSPPILLASEPRILSRFVDGILLVVMADRAPQRAIRKAVDSIGREKIIGVIFNQINLKPAKYYSKYYCRYYR